MPILHSGHSGTVLYLSSLIAFAIKIAWGATYSSFRNQVHDQIFIQKLKHVVVDFWRLMKRNTGRYVQYSSPDMSWFRCKDLPRSVCLPFRQSALECFPSYLCIAQGIRAHMAPIRSKAGQKRTSFPFSTRPTLTTTKHLIFISAQEASNNPCCWLSTIHDRATNQSHRH